MDYRENKKHPHKYLVILLLVILAAIAGTLFYLYRRQDQPGSPEDAQQIISSFASSHGIPLSQYPESIRELLERNPETRDFVLHYPMEYGEKQEVDMSDYEDTEGIPLFLQWDRRWGYLDYGDDVAGLTACGPMCLAMAGWGLTGDHDTFRPDHVIRFAIEEGYCVTGQGSSWTLISEGGEKLGLEVEELPLVEGLIIENLEAGHPVICIMGPGKFTTGGHFIVLTDYKNGHYRINDPNSRRNSRKRWEFSDFEGEVLNLWSIQ